MQRVKQRVGFVSDTHLEDVGSLDGIYEMLPAPGSVDVFLVVGDATRGYWAFDLCVMIHEYLGCPVLYTPGNHEFYYTHELHCTMQEMEAESRAAFAGHQSVHYLQGDSVTIGDVSYFGSTWWTNFRGYGSEYMTEATAISEHVADFRFINIERMTPTQITDRVNMLNRSSGVMRGQAHYENARVSFFHKITAQDMIDLNSEIVGKYKKWYEATPGKKVLMAHFPMLKDLQHSGFKPNPYFVSADDLLIERLAPDLLVFAHTHCNYQKTLYGIPCVSNQFGYKSEQTGFDPMLTVEV